ncbi:MAG: CpaF family protein [Deltaproteobacteria bacterium]|nr:CpaF family protein [Deltaproteobacteria bacterium]
MKLRDRLKLGHDSNPDLLAAAQEMPAVYHDMKRAIHDQLVDRLELQKLDRLKPEELRAELRNTITDLIVAAQLPLNRIERERLIQELLDEITGLGPLEPLLADPTIADILVNGYNTVFIEREGRILETSVRFRDNDHLMQIINRIVSRIGRRVDETSPMVDARLPDGSRVNAIIPPLALDGPALSIRRFGGKPLLAPDLVAGGSLTPAMLDFVAAAVRARLNILISGGTGSGKTTMLNAMSAFIPPTERIVTIEDAAELQLQQRHVVRLETRPPNLEGKGAITQRDLVRNSLRMRPDRIIVGEVRGAEVMDMLQAMNTGHDGSMTTVHANSPRDALTRLGAMVGMAGAVYSESVMSLTLSRALNMVVHLSRGSDGKRRVLSISEITGMEGSVITMQEIFMFRQRGVDANGHVLGESVATGIRPQSLERIQRAGYGTDISFRA